MSQVRYNQLWQRTQKNLNRIIGVERPKSEVELPEERAVCFEELSGRYVKYSMIYKSLQECYDNMVHPQKRILMEKLLEAVTGRVIEMRYELERLSVSEYINLVDTCFDLKVSVDDIELNLGYTHHAKKMQHIHKRVVLLDYILHATQSNVNDLISLPFMCTIPEAVRLIQKNQRAFMARKRAAAYKRKLELRRRLAQARSSNTIEDHIRGVIAFQSLWRGYSVRSKLSEVRNWTAELIGMHMPSALDSEHAMEVKKTTVTNKNINKALKRDDDYRKDLEVKSEEYYEKHNVEIQTDMQREIRQWILEYHNLMGAFPEYPSEEDGGSLALFSYKSIAELEDELDEMGDDKAKKEKGGKKKKDKKKKDKKDKKKDKKGKKGKGNIDGSGPFVMKPSQVLDSEVIPSAQEYNDCWLYKNEDDNRKQVYDKNQMMHDIHMDAERTLRVQVDELMRAELIALETGISRKLAGKPKKKKGGKKGKGKKGKKGKKKKGKDLTEGVPLEDLYKELILGGIVKKVPQENLKDFIGEVNLMCPKDSSEMEFRHDLGDVRKMIFDYAILPMSSPAVHAKAPLLKSLMIVGPEGSGKTMLVNAICTELGANLFDLSPANIEEVYTDKEGEKRLVHLVTKVGKLMEPTVIFINNCDRMFTKKLPPDDHTKPARLKKELTKALKQITAEDRVLLVGTSKAPFGAAMKPLAKMYEKMIFIYPPSSKSRYTLWKRFITDNKGIIPITNFELTPLTHVSNGYTAANIRNAVVEVLTEKRVLRQQVKPLTTQEFVTRLATFEPVFVEELEAYEKWLLKTPMRKKLAIVHELEKENEEVLGLL